MSGAADQMEIPAELREAMAAWNRLTDAQRAHLLRDAGYHTPADAMRALGHQVPAREDVIA